ncbi:MAG TPA: alpha/beta fold hydrolase [Candidatus Binataceae bacterium]|nr:alpha/beta fold hydrolase [Candidatus Binataceae bacterium]
MLQRRVSIAILCALLLACALAAAETGFAAGADAPSETLHIAGLDVAAWIPSRDTPGPWPIIIFSHGFHGCNTQSAFLTAALAQAGYAVFAPNHRDAACKGQGQLRNWLKRPVVPFDQPNGWSDATYADRDQDIEKLVDALSANPQYRSPPFDWNRLGLAGHSLGGYTVLGVAGAWPRWKDRRVRAVLALSPYTNPFLVRKTLDDLDAPVMYQGGTNDVGITPFVKKRDGAYDQSPAPKYFVEFEGAGHMAWTNLRDTYHPAIIDYSRAFLDHYLKGKPLPANFADSHKDVSAFEMKQ